jgi:hypothetical protein
MKEYRAKQRQLKKEIENRNKSINILTDAIKGLNPIGLPRPRETMTQ